MKASDIMTLYTQTIAQYISEGYTFGRDHYLDGSRHFVELVKGTSYVKVAIREDYDFDNDFDYVKLEVTKGIISKEKANCKDLRISFGYYPIDCEYTEIGKWIKCRGGYETPEEHEAREAIREARAELKSSYMYKKSVNLADNIKVLKIVFKWLKRQTGFKSVHMEDIVSIEKYTRRVGVPLRYLIITNKGKEAVLEPSLISRRAYR